MHGCRLTSSGLSMLRTLACDTHGPLSQCATETGEHSFVLHTVAPMRAHLCKHDCLVCGLRSGGDCQRSNGQRSARGHQRWPTFSAPVPSHRGYFSRRRLIRLKTAGTEGVPKQGKPPTSFIAGSDLIFTAVPLKPCGEVILRSGDLGPARMICFARVAALSPEFLEMSAGLYPS